MEKNLQKDEDCAIYAEQFLDILEEIASLYRSNMIPRRAADYFENRFSYGINLWKWYHKKVLNYTDKLTESLWIMDDENPTKKDRFGKHDKEKSKIAKNLNFRKFVFGFIKKPMKKKIYFLRRS